MKSLVLLADVPHAVGGHVLLVSSLDDDLSEFYLAPRLQAARQSIRCRGVDALSIRRETVQRAAGIESNRTALEVLMLFGTQIKTLSDAQVEDIFGKLEQRLNNISVLASADVTDRRGFLHVSPMLANWLEDDDFASGVMTSSSQATTRVKPKGELPWMGTSASRVGTVLLWGIVLVATSVLFVNCFHVGTGDRKSATSTDHSSTALRTESPSPKSNIHPSDKVVAGVPRDSVNGIQLRLRKLHNDQPRWEASLEEYQNLAGHIAGMPYESEVPNTISLREQFSDMVFSSAHGEIATLDRNGTDEFESILIEHDDSLRQVAFKSLIKRQRKQIAELLEFFRANQAQLKNSVPSVGSNADWQPSLKRLADRAIYAYYDLIRKELDASFLGKGPEPVMTIEAGSEMTALKLLSIPGINLPVEVEEREEVFRLSIGLGESKSPILLDQLKELTFEVVPRVKNLEIEQVSILNSNATGASKLKVLMSTLERSQEHIATLSVEVVDKGEEYRNSARYESFQPITQSLRAPGTIQLRPIPADKRRVVRRVVDVIFRLTKEDQSKFDAAVDWLGKLKKRLNEMKALSDREM
ncbi:MAG: hypothetical protein JWM11_967 [Planctomycetaceae bacterium]|nr:hypothetical protein [Planctomycetaceae bacterium]